MAAMLVAVSRLAEEPVGKRPTILMACSVNEEHGYSGAVDLARLWKDGAQSIIPRQPDAAIVAEPTNLQVVVAHKGTLRWKCHTTGRAAHSSQPHLGKNAIYRMSRVVAALEAYARDITPTLARHALCGGVTLSVGTIRGGLSVNTVPDACTIEIDRRLVPGENSREARQHVIDFIASYPGVDFEVMHDAPFMDGATLSEGPNERLATALSAVARERFGAGNRIGVPYGTDASKLAAAGVPSVVFGPGSIDQAHTIDEWVALDEVERASEVLYQFGRRGL
jgi:acetylornithine deacetylase